MRKYEFEATEAQLKIMKKYWKLFCEEEDKFIAKRHELEEALSKETGIPNLRLLIADSCSYGGIVNEDGTMKFYSSRELKDNGGDDVK